MNTINQHNARSTDALENVIHNLIATQYLKLHIKLSHFTQILATTLELFCKDYVLKLFCEFGVVIEVVFLKFRHNLNNKIEN